jgi:hypothetical protein
LTGAFDTNKRGWIKTAENNGRMAAKRMIEEKYELIKFFSAYPEFSYFFPMVSREDFLQIKRIKLSGNYKPIVSGYSIYIYKKKI